jgi:LPXTG-site transpeptidase (sortase) family protein
MDKAWQPGHELAEQPQLGNRWHRRVAGKLLYGAGCLFLVLAACYVSFAVASGWFNARDRFLAGSGISDHSLIMPTRTPTPIIPTPAYVQTAPDQPAWPDVVSGRTPPARIRIPALDVDRAIIELQQIREPRTGAWTRDVGKLFRRGREDLVGHWGGSAYPGGEGNVVLVGHNYTYTGTGVFLQLGRLQSGQEVEVVDQEGQVFLYRVSHVERLPWRQKNAAELQKHSDLLYPGGSERLTLVTCSGGNAAPFAQRIYVIAEPVF